MHIHIYIYIYIYFQSWKKTIWSGSCFADGTIQDRMGANLVRWLLRRRQALWSLQVWRPERHQRLQRRWEGPGMTRWARSMRWKPRPAGVTSAMQYGDSYLVLKDVRLGRQPRTRYLVISWSDDQIWAWIKTYFTFLYHSFWVMKIHLL